MKILGFIGLSTLFEKMFEIFGLKSISDGNTLNLKNFALEISDKLFANNRDSAKLGEGMLGYMVLGQSLQEEN